MRTIGTNGLALVKSFEGLFLKAYKDPVGIWTIGYGHTGLEHKDGTVYAGRTITEAEADDLLAYDMNKFAAGVEKMVRVPLNDNQFDALTSFDFNTGGLIKSTLLRLLNAGNYFDASGQFELWNKGTVNGKKVELRGLTRRRLSERNLFCSFPGFIVAG